MGSLDKHIEGAEPRLLLKGAEVLIMELAHAVGVVAETCPYAVRYVLVRCLRIELCDKRRAWCRGTRHSYGGEGDFFPCSREKPHQGAEAMESVPENV